MEPITKTPVEIVQELIAIHTTRKEAAAKFSGVITGMDTASITQQSDQSINVLMAELSHFGDGVNSEAIRENDYQQIYKDALPKIDGISEQDGREIFSAMENSLIQIYQHILQSQKELPESLHQVLEKQASLFGQGS